MAQPPVMRAKGSKRALVIGASGVFGALTIRAFEAAGWQVRCGARRPEAGQLKLDLDRSESIAAALQDHELVVNTVPHPDLLAERHVLEHGGTLINVSALPAAASRSLRAVAGDARGTVLMNAGLAPGVTTLVAADLLRVHPEATELEIVFTVSAAAPRGPASAEFIRRGLAVMAHHRTVIAPLPQPFGERLCLAFSEDDAGWLGGIAEGRVVRQYICFAEVAVHGRLLALNQEGAMTELPTSAIVARKPRKHGAASAEPVAHWIAAIRSGLRLGARTVECRGESVHAARCTVVLADALLARDGDRGCFDPEEICALSDVEARLRAEGVSIVTQATAR